MKSSSLVLGVFVMIGIVAGAFVIALAGRRDSGNLESELQTASTKIDVLLGRVNQLDGEVSRLNQQLNSSQLLAENNAQRIAEVSKSLSSLARPDKLAHTGPQPGLGAGSKADPGSGLPAGSPAIETLKEEVKKELKEERKKEEEERRLKMASQMKEMETKRWQKKLDEEFPKLAEKINLSTTQEFAIKEIAEEAFKKIMALWEEAMSKPEDEVDWAGFQEKMEKIYKDAETQVTEMVSKEQAEALEKFFEER